MRILKDKLDDPTPVILDRLNTKFYNHSKYDLSRLTQDSQNIYMNFNNYINGYSENIREVEDNFQMEKQVEKLNKNNRLFILIDKFTEVDLSPDKVNNHTMGQVFEELLRRFSEMSNETSGAGAGFAAPDFFLDLGRLSIIGNLHHIDTALVAFAAQPPGQIDGLRQSFKG